MNRSTFLGLIESTGTWVPYKPPEGYAFDALDITVMTCPAGGILAITPEAQQSAPPPPDYSLPDQQGMVWQLPAGATLPVGGVRFRYEGLAGLRLRGFGIDSGGGSMIVSVAATLCRCPS